MTFSWQCWLPGNVMRPMERNQEEGMAGLILCLAQEFSCFWQWLGWVFVLFFHSLGVGVYISAGKIIAWNICQLSKINGVLFLYFSQNLFSAISLELRTPIPPLPLHTHTHMHKPTPVSLLCIFVEQKHRGTWILPYLCLYSISLPLFFFALPSSRVIIADCISGPPQPWLQRLPFRRNYNQGFVYSALLHMHHTHTKSPTFGIEFSIRICHKK